MFSFIKDKINQQIQNAQKKINNTSQVIALTQLSQNQQRIYEQIDSYLQIGVEITEIFQQKLYQYINSGNICYDSEFLMSIKVLMIENLQNKNRERLSRTLTIIQKLVSHCSKIVSQTFNSADFCDALAEVALYKKYVSLNYEQWDVIRQRAAGIFLFWYNKYKTEAQHFVYLSYMIKIRDNKGDVPMQPFFKEMQQKQVKQQQQSLDINSTITGSLIMADEAEQLLVNNTQKIDTQYVRALKLKNKMLYKIATQKCKDLDQDTKTRLNGAYKRLRNILKQIQKWNENNNKERAIKQQKKYLQQKITKMNSNKKKNMENTDLLIDDHNLNSQKQDQIKNTESPNLLDQHQNIMCSPSHQHHNMESLLDDQYVPSKQQYRQKTPEKHQSPNKNNQNIIDIDNYSTPQKKSKQQLISQTSSDYRVQSSSIHKNSAMNSAQKSDNKFFSSQAGSQNLLDTDENRDLKTLNFTQLYKQSSTPQKIDQNSSLQGIDFMSSPQSHQKQQIVEHHQSSDKKLKKDDSINQENDYLE